VSGGLRRRWTLIALAPDTLIVALDSPTAAYAVPRQGGAPRVLPVPPEARTKLMGVGLTGAL
jgi:hypothetical protein